MYEHYYGLRELPFDLTPNPRYLCLTARHREALSNLKYGILGRRGITLLIGEAGTGKTTLVRAVLESEQLKNCRFVYLNNPMLTRGEFIEFLAGAFELGEHAASSKTALLVGLEHTLRERRAQGIVTALLVDEAQALSLELLEEVRLLANIETATEKLLAVVLAGQPQLARRLNEPDLQQLKQRIALRCDLRPLNLRETMAYIAGRIQIAGGDSARLFTREAIELIHQASRGVPRTISVICDNALVSGLAADQQPVGWEIISEVCKDFDFALPRPWAQAQPAADTATPAAAGSLVARVERELDTMVPVRGCDSLFSMFTRKRRYSFF